ncbi:MAG: hypothetical protein Q9183_001573 [Haloplaca sp. 2 TL-2023]
MASKDATVDRSAQILSIQISMAALAVLVVSLRLFSRFKILKSPGWDDYIIAAGMASDREIDFALGLTQTVLNLTCLSRGSGKHTVDLQSKSDLEYILKISYLSAIFGPLVMVSVKDSLLVLYLRISPDARFQRWVKGLLWLFTIDAIVWSYMAAFQCTPISHAWIWSESGHCMNRDFLYKAQGPCAAIIARLIPSTESEVFRTDLSWWLATVQNWIAVEYSTGMICCSLILLKPLVQLLCPRLLGGTSHRRTRGAAVWHGHGEPAQARIPLCHNIHAGPRTPVPSNRKRDNQTMVVETNSPMPISQCLQGLQSPDLEYHDDPFPSPSSGAYDADPRRPSST